LTKIGTHGNKLAKFYGKILSLSENIAKKSFFWGGGYFLWLTLYVLGLALKVRGSETKKIHVLWEKLILAVLGTHMCARCIDSLCATEWCWQ